MPLKESKTPPIEALSSKAVYVKYADHVFFRNADIVPSVQPIIRETIGWVKGETEEALLLESDRPLLKGCKGFNGVIILKSCIISMSSVPLADNNLNSITTKSKASVRFQPKKAKNSALKEK